MQGQGSSDRRSTSYDPMPIRGSEEDQVDLIPAPSPAPWHTLSCKSLSLCGKIWIWSIIVILILGYGIWMTRVSWKRWLGITSLRNEEEYWKKSPRFQPRISEYGLIDHIFANHVSSLPTYRYSFQSHYPPINRSTGTMMFAPGIRSLRIDVGLSYNAPISSYWLSRYPDTAILAFEPNPESVLSLFTGDTSRGGRFIEHVSEIHSRFFLIHAAINNGSPRFENFYMASDDPGTSSLSYPLEFEVKRVFPVLNLPLAEVFACIPWNRFPYVSHLKVDAQGFDLLVLQSVGSFLSERVVFVSAEPTAPGYAASHTADQLHSFMTESGFDLIDRTNEEMIFRNTQFRSEAQTMEYLTR